MEPLDHIRSTTDKYDHFVRKAKAFGINSKPSAASHKPTLAFMLLTAVQSLNLPLINKLQLNKFLKV